MSTMNQKRAKIKPARHARVLIWLPDIGRGGIALTETSPRGKVSADCYELKELPCELAGRAFRIEKDGGDQAPYDVLLAGAESSCECLGFLRHGHCKHVQGLQALERAGKLPRNEEEALV